MPTLTIDLQEGFSGESAEIVVDGTLFARESRIVSRMQIGYAGRVAVEVAPGVHAVEIRVPERGLSLMRSVDAGKTPHLGVSMEENTLRVQAADQPFGYV